MIMKNFIKTSLAIILSTSVYNKAFAINEEITCPDGTPDNSVCWKCGSKCYATLTGTTMNITGSGSIDATYADNLPGIGWYTKSSWGNYTIDTINVGKNITHIGQDAFNGMLIHKVNFEDGSKLTSMQRSVFNVQSAVVLPPSLTSMENGAIHSHKEIYCTTTQMNGVCKNLSNAMLYEIQNNKFIVHDGDNIHTYNLDRTKEYDSNDNVIANYDSRGNKTESYNYSAGGQLLSANTYDSEGNVTGSYTYDAGGNLVSAYQNGKAVYLRKRYTIPEADAATQGKGPFRLDITW